VRPRRDPRRLAQEQRRYAVGGAAALVALGVAAFAAGTALLVLDETLPVSALVCLEVGGVASLLVGLKKLRDLRRGD
jgi:hypothetical protein